MLQKIRLKKAAVSGLLVVIMLVAGFSIGLGGQGDSAKKSLKVALLPILDTFPFYVAEAQGYNVNLLDTTLVSYSINNLQFFEYKSHCEEWNDEAILWEGLDVGALKAKRLLHCARNDRSKKSMHLIQIKSTNNQ